MSNLISGIFPTRSSADRAVQDLLEDGFKQADISVLHSDSNIGSEFNVE